MTPARRKLGFYRTARASGIGIEAIVPSKTPRAIGDRVKTDRRDADLFARRPLAGSLKAVVVPTPEVEAARELTRAHDSCRWNLMTARHRVSKMLLHLGIVYPKNNAWSTEHRRRLTRQHFSEPMSEPVFGDLVAHVDGLTARKAELAEQISQLVGPVVVADRRAPASVPRDRHTDCAIDPFRARALTCGVLSDRLRGAACMSYSETGAVRGVLTPGIDHQDRIRSCASAADRIGVTLRPPDAARRDAGQTAARSARARAADQRPRQQRLDCVHGQMKARGKPHNVIVVAA
jgi:hypothetical protein